MDRNPYGGSHPYQFKIFIKDLACLSIRCHLHLGKDGRAACGYPFPREMELIKYIQFYGGDNPRSPYLLLSSRLPPTSFSSWAPYFPVVSSFSRTGGCRGHIPLPRHPVPRWNMGWCFYKWRRSYRVMMRWSIKACSSNEKL